MNIIRKSGKRVYNEHSDKPLFVKGKEIDMLDYSETTAMNQFAEIRFKESGKCYITKIEDIKEK